MHLLTPRDNRCFDDVLRNKKRSRQRRDLNSRGQSPVDFESTSLTTRTRCLCYSSREISSTRLRPKTRKRQVLPGLEPGLQGSEPWVLTNYTIEPACAAVASSLIPIPILLSTRNPRSILLQSNVRVYPTILQYICSPGVLGYIISTCLTRGHECDPRSENILPSVILGEKKAIRAENRTRDLQCVRLT